MLDRIRSWLRRFTLWQALPPFLLILIGWGVGLSLAHLWGARLWQKVPPPPPPPLRKSTTSDAPPPWDQYQAIIQANLFQVETALAPSQSTQTVTQPAILEPLPVELIGTIAGGEKLSFAFLRHKNSGKIESYQVGDRIQDATLIRIRRAAIDLYRQGKVETITLVETTLVLSAQATMQPQPLPPPIPGILTPEPGSPPLLVRQESENRYIVDRRSFQSVINDLGPLLTQARVIPNLTGDGKINGYRIIAIKEGSLYEKIGLKDGDIIYSINGINVDNPERALQLFQQLRSETEFQIEIERSGEHRTLSYSLR